MNMCVHMCVDASRREWGEDSGDLYANGTHIVNI